MFIELRAGRIDVKTMPSAIRSLTQMRASFNEKLLAQDYPIRMSQQRTLKLLSLLLDPEKHDTALLLIEYGLPRQYAQNSDGDAGETLTILQGLGITKYFAGPVFDEWKKMY